VEPAQVDAAFAEPEPRRLLGEPAAVTVTSRRAGVSMRNGSRCAAIGYADSKVNDTNIIFTAITGPIVAGTQQTIFSSLIKTRPYRKYRVVISGIVNVTYRVEMFTTDVD
jgi:hypothetical protein